MVIESVRKFLASRLYVLVGVALIFAFNPARADTVFESPKESVPLIELFTSEGCNSCPPADAWLSSLRTSEGLWSRFVPVAFHVTYWDSLGWRDRFGQPEFDALHEETATRAKAQVYTPGVFVAGREWSTWRRAPFAINDQQDAVVGVLRVEAANAIMGITFDSLETFNRLNVHLAWLQADQTTQVRRGENAGKSLHHEFVARALSSARMEMSGRIWRASVPASAADRGSSQAVAIWVVDDTGRPVQATGGWLQNVDRQAGGVP